MELVNILVGEVFLTTSKY